MVYIVQHDPTFLNICVNVHGSFAAATSASLGTFA